MSTVATLFGRVAAIGTALAVIAGLISNSKAIYEFGCKAAGFCTAPSYRIEDSYSTYQDVHRLNDQLRSFAGKVVYMDIGVSQPAFEAENSLDDVDEISDPANYPEGTQAPEANCAKFFTQAAEKDILRQPMKYCVPKSADGRFGPANPSLFVWQGYFFIGPPVHIGQGFYQTNAKPLAPEMAIPLLRAQ